MMKAKWFVALACVAMALVVCAPDSMAAGSNTIPYQTSFESFSQGHAISNEVGWRTGRNSDIVVVTNMSSGLTSPYFPSETDTKTLSVLGLVTCDIEPDTTIDHVYVDLLVYPGCREDPPTMPNDKLPWLHPQFACYVNTDQHLVFYHSYYDEGWDAPAFYHRVWTTNTVDTVPSNRWTRLTIEFDYTEATYFDGYLSIRVNGGARFSHSLGYSVISSENTEPDGGPWFLCASLPNSSPGAFVSNVTVSGSCFIDDLVVSDSRPFVPPDRTAHGTPYAWLLTYYPGTPPENYETQDAADSDGDGMTTWQEYWAGTDPTDGDSRFAIVSIGADWTIKWTAGTNQDNPPFRVWRSTNLLNQASWDWYTNRDRTVGTNVWTDTTATSFQRLFYKVTAPTNY